MTSDLVLAPAVRLLWRAVGVIQLELGSRAVVVRGADEQLVRALTGSQATHTLPEHTRAAIGTLYELGFLWSRVAALRARVPEIPRHLRTELGSLGARFGERSREVLDRRLTSRVALHGTGRLVAHIGSLLAAAGVGHVYVADSGDIGVDQFAPGGLLPRDEGSRFAAAAAGAIQAAAPHVRTGPPPYRERIDLRVAVSDGPEWLGDPAELEHAPRLHARVGADVGVVGPLTVPGRSSCARCVDLHRLDRDRAWSALAVQLSTRPPAVRPSDVGLAAIVAGLASLQALEFLDGQDPATLNGSLEVHLPDWRVRRRTWPPHSHCSCRSRPP